MRKFQAVAIGALAALAVIVGCVVEQSTQPVQERPTFKSRADFDAYARTLPHLAEYFAERDALAKQPAGPEVAFTTTYISCVLDGSAVDVSVINGNDCLKFVDLAIGHAAEEDLNSSTFEPIGDIEMDNDDVATVWILTRNDWGGTDAMSMSWDWDGAIYLVGPEHDNLAECNIGNPWNHCLLRLNGEPTCTAASNLQASHGCEEWEVLE